MARQKDSEPFHLDHYLDEQVFRYNRSPRTTRERCRPLFSVGNVPSLVRVMAAVEPDIVYVDNADVIRWALTPQKVGEQDQTK